MGGASTGGSDTSDDKKQDTYSTQFKKNYKTTKDGKIKKKNIIEKAVDTGGLVLGAIKNNPLSKYTEKVNRDFFENKVKKAGKSKYDNYEDYIRARGRGEVDAYGREIKNTGGGNNQTILTETNQNQEMDSEATETSTSYEVGDENLTAEEIALRNKRKGRKKNIKTSVTGDTSEATLDQKSLLGGD